MVSLRKKIDYLYELEMNNYQLNLAINQMQDYYNRLGSPSRFVKPVRRREDLERNIDKKSEHLFLLPVIGFFLVIVAYYIDGIFVSNDLFPIDLGTVLQSLLCGGVGVVAGFIIKGILSFILGVSSTAKNNSSNKATYKNDVDRYELAIKKDRIRCDREINSKPAVAENINQLKNRLAQSKAFLNECYIKCGINKEYRNLIPIGYMKMYMDLRISDHLDGVDGLYYLVRQELRQDQFSMQLSEISSKLDMIIDKQTVLYSQLREIDRKCGNMVSLAQKQCQQLEMQNQKLDDIRLVASFGTFFAACTAREMSIANDLSMRYRY